MYNYKINSKIVMTTYIFLLIIIIQSSIAINLTFHLLNEFMVIVV